MKFVHISDTARIRRVCLLHLKLCEICSIIPIWCIYSHTHACTKHIEIESELVYLVVHFPGSSCVPKHTTVHAYIGTEHTHTLMEIWGEEKEWVNIKFVFEEFPPSPCIRRDISIRWKFWSHRSVNAQYSTYHTYIYKEEKRSEAKRREGKIKIFFKKKAGKTP